MELISTPPKPARCIESSSRTISFSQTRVPFHHQRAKSFDEPVGRAEFLVEFACGNLFQEGVARQVAPFRGGCGVGCGEGQCGSDTEGEK